MDVTRLEKLRPCGRLETYSTARHHLGFYNNVGLTATYTTPSNLRISIQDLVFAALHHVIAEHPNLSAILVHEDKSFPDVYFARLPEFDLDTCVEFRMRGHAIPQDDEADIDLGKLLSQQHIRNFKSSVPGPYWRLIVTAFPSDRQVFTASWIFHHALADGASAMMFHETLLEGLNNFMRAPVKDFATLVSAPSITLALPLEDLHPMTVSWPFFVSAVAGSLMPKYLKRKPWTGPPIGRMPPQSTANACVVLSAETTQAFAGLCRKQGTSVTATLSTLLASVIVEILGPLCDEIKIGMPISLRPVLNVGKKQMLNAITNHTSIFRRSDFVEELEDETYWKIARRVKSELAVEVSKEGTDNPIALLKYVSNMHDYFNEKLGRERETTAEVSNLGVYRPQTLNTEENLVSPKRSLQLEDESSSWAIGRMVFSQSLNHTGPAICLSAVTGGDGCLAMSFNWPQDPMKDSEATEQSLRLVPGLVKQSILDLVRTPVYDTNGADRGE
ncbi:Alcohol acetyltransferase [Didymella sp. IMI 355093]|nr:Alcohol acetyltransferase [Didymella sp. IMI 355093]